MVTTAIRMIDSAEASGKSPRRPIFINELLMPQLVMMQIGRRGDFPLASALSIILMAVVTVAYLACARWLKIERA